VCKVLPESTGHKLTVILLQIVLKDNVEEALIDLEYLQLIDSLAHPPDLTVLKASYHDSELSHSNNIQRNLEILEANTVSTCVLLELIHAVMVHFAFPSSAYPYHHAIS